ncbi:hypothetical protein [Kitasatospora cinereorecta]|uniref:Uncharacterized protein n=1 Tax=Kitasatospora cinereorecta TaxID=285560 RepID=A0ABW0V708_9ACTN
MVIVIAGTSGHHGGCNAAEVPSDGHCEVHTLVRALTNGTRRAILVARAGSEAVSDAYSAAALGTFSVTRCECGGPASEQR